MLFLILVYVLQHPRRRVSYGLIRSGDTNSTQRVRKQVAGGYKLEIDGADRLCLTLYMDENKRMKFAFSVDECERKQLEELLDDSVRY